MLTIVTFGRAKEPCRFVGFIPNSPWLSAVVGNRQASECGRRVPRGHPRGSEGFFGAPLRPVHGGLAPLAGTRPGWMWPTRHSPHTNVKPLNPRSALLEWRFPHLGSNRGHGRRSSPL